MPWWQKSASSSPKSSSTSPPPSPPRRSNNLKELNNFFRRTRLRSNPKPCLTRQRKLRHLSDLEVGRLPYLNRFPDSNHNHKRNPFHSRSHSEDTNITNSLTASPSLTTLVIDAPSPQPLPLPEAVASRHESVLSASPSGRFPLPSPKAVSSRGDPDEDTDSILSVDAGAIARKFPYQTSYKKTEHVDTLSTNSSVDRGKRLHQDPNGVENFRNNFGLSSSNLSAPPSGFSSPALSPRTMSPCPYVAVQGLQIWSAPEMADMDMLTAFSKQASPDKTLVSPERSPLHTPGLNRKSSSGFASPLHHRLSLESSASWHDSTGHATVHPLPLPPGAALSSQTVFAHQATNKPELSPVKNQWQKGKLIGRGTFGSVYVGTNRETGALCAMKEVDLIPDDSKSAECIKQLEQEITLLSQLKHPNIVQYYGSEIVEDHFYIYLEYVHPGSINKYIRDHCGTMSESVVRNFTRHILSGLAYLHSTNTVHRDIKGANLLVDAFGVVKLADFGMAKHLSGQTTDLSLKGSPYWMAPEIISSEIQKDRNGDFAFAVDIWSLGCTIIEMLDGKPPWSEFEGAAAMFKVWKESPPIPETLSLAGKDFLRRCFRRNPADRPSASMLLDHPFLRISPNLDVPACMQAFAGMKLRDPSYHPREWTKYTSDSIPVSPMPQTIKEKLSPNG